MRPTTSYSDLGDADIVIEAAFERMAVKKAVFAETVQHAREDAILATNTSTLDVDEIAESTGCPERVVGAWRVLPCVRATRARRLCLRVSTARAWLRAWLHAQAPTSSRQPT